MGNDTISTSASTWNRKRTSRTSSPHHSSISAPLEWGPAGLVHQQIGAGSQEERVAAVRDAKRKTLLNINGYSMPDASGRHKRRTSDDIDSSALNSNPQTGEDALVYIHTIKPGDTLAGLTIKYNCQAVVLRKANRIWPNDPIQSRRKIMVPVDGCRIKGVVVPGPEEQSQEVDLLGDETITMHESPVLNQNGWAKDLSFTSPNNQPSLPSPTLSSQQEPEAPWKHDSWVLLPNDTKPTEIVRLSRSSLGYFPRARRKSNTFSDLTSSRATSFDLPRPSTGSPIPQSPTRSPSRTARSSTPRARASSNSLASILTGPGGVGTLGRHVRAPGPGPERLSEMFAPNGPAFVAPPSHLTVFTPWTPALLDPSDPSSIGSSEFAAAGANAGVGMDFQDVGGAIEKWVRRAARKAANALETNSANAHVQRGNAGVASLGAMGGGMGDLIELVDAFEIGDGIEQPDSRPGGSEILENQPLSTNVADASVSAWDRGVGGNGVMRGRKSGRDGGASMVSGRPAV